jgi:hypothetical protein
LKIFILPDFDRPLTCSQVNKELWLGIRTATSRPYSKLNLLVLKEEWKMLCFFIAFSNTSLPLYTLLSSILWELTPYVRKKNRKREKRERERGIDGVNVMWLPINNANKRDVSKNLCFCQVRRDFYHILKSIFAYFMLRTNFHLRIWERKRNRSKYFQ